MIKTHFLTFNEYVETRFADCGMGGMGDTAEDIIHTLKNWPLSDTNLGYTYYSQVVNDYESLHVVTMED